MKLIYLGPFDGVDVERGPFRATVMQGEAHLFPRDIAEALLRDAPDHWKTDEKKGKD